MLEKLERLVDEIGVLHSRLVLLVGLPESGKTRLLRLFGESRGIAPLNLGSALGGGSLPCRAGSARFRRRKCHGN